MLAQVLVADVLVCDIVAVPADIPVIVAWNSVPTTATAVATAVLLLLQTYVDDWTPLSWVVLPAQTVPSPGDTGTILGGIRVNVMSFPTRQLVPDAKL